MPTFRRGGRRKSALGRAACALALASAWLAPDAPAMAQAPVVAPVAAPLVAEEVVARSVRSRGPIGSTSVKVDAESRSVAGVAGDALAIVQNLPGVARPPAGSNDLVVWGAAPAETRIYIDDVPIPSLYHRGGLRSVVNSAMISRVDLVPAGYGSAYGRATGGLVRLQTSVPREGAAGVLTLDPFDASLASSHGQTATVGPWTLATGARYGWLDRLAPVFGDDVRRTFALPAYSDVAMKILHRDGSVVWELLVLGARDDVDRVIAEPLTSLERGQRTLDAFGRIALRRRWTDEHGDSGSFLLWTGGDVSNLESRFGSLVTARRTQTTRAGARASRKVRVAPSVNVEVGADVELERNALVRRGTLGLPPREGDQVVFGQPPSDETARESWVNHFVGAAPFAEIDWSIADWLTLSSGLRLEAMMIAGDRQVPPASGGIDVGYTNFKVFPDPRFRAEARLLPPLTAHVAAGLYHQAPDSRDTSAVFGGTNLVPSEGAHLVAGLTMRVSTKASLETTVFTRRLTNVAVRSLAESPSIARTITSDGSARTNGGQAVFRLSSWRGLYGWVSYAIARSERRAGPDQPWRLSDFDQSHVLVASVGFAPSPGWRFGARARASTGYPRTPIVGSYYDARSDTFQPLRGAHNTERLPSFVQLDLHGERSVTWRGASWSVYADLLNLTNQTNAEEVVYSFDYREQGYLTGLPFMGIVGLRGEL